jgi:hypothetical protein
MAAALCILATLGSLWVLAALPVAAKPAKNRSVMVPAAKPGAVPTDRTPTNRSNCLAVAHALNEQAKTLSKRTKQGIPREFTRVASDLDATCGEEDFGKAWISIEWMKRMPQQFHKGLRVGVLFQKRRLRLRNCSTLRRLLG